MKMKLYKIKFDICDIYTKDDFRYCRKKIFILVLLNNYFTSIKINSFVYKTLEPGLFQSSKYLVWVWELSAMQFLSQSFLCFCWISGKIISRRVPSPANTVTKTFLRCSFRSKTREQRYVSLCMEYFLYPYTNEV